MHKILKKVRKLAKIRAKTIVFPEGTEERILHATREIQKKRLAKIILLGSVKEIKKNALALKIKLNYEKLIIIDPKKNKYKEKFAQELYEIRKDKGLTKPKAKRLIEDINYFGTILVHMGIADGMVTGTTFSTADSIRPALQIIKTKEKFHKVSGVFFMIMENRLMLFADTAITIEPNSHDLKDITLDTIQTAEKLGIKPKVALLSFSTKGSAQHPNIDKIREAVAMIKSERPDVTIDGELQIDAALVASVAERKCPKSPIQGNANILIFPDLQSANIAYKLTERLAKAKAIGPILQGLKKPINDLSRGCSYEDIVNVTAFTACECED